MTSDVDRVSKMVAVVRAAARICRRVQRDLAHVETAHKDDASPVTVADLAGQALVGHTLLPELDLVGEEDSRPLREDPKLRDAVLERLQPEWPNATPEELYAAVDRGSASGEAPVYLTLDPIDGTKGFLRGDQYAVALALIEDGRPSIGILACPNLPDLRDDGGIGLVLVAERGRGTRALAMGGDETEGRPVVVSTRDDPTTIRLCESVVEAHTSHGESARLAEQLGIAVDPVRIDSQAKYAMLALGRAEAYLRIPRNPARRECIWDHAAGAIVVSEAGGRVTDLDGVDLDFGRGRRLEGNRGILASNGHVHTAVLGLTRSSQRDA